MSSGGGTSFCVDCGLPLPAMDGDKTMWFVPAGLPDEDPEVGVRGHMLVGDMPSREVIGDDALQFEGKAP